MEGGDMVDGVCVREVGIFRKSVAAQSHRLNAAEVHTSSRARRCDAGSHAAAAAAAGAISDTSRVKSLC